MPNIGGPEIIFLLVIVLIVFGAGKLPDVLGQLGRGVRTFRDESTNADKPASTPPSSTAPTAPTQPENKTN